MVKQLSVRMHPNQHTMLMALLKRDELTFQKLYTFIIEGYLNADPRVMAFLREARKLDKIPKGERDQHVIPWRERQSLLDEIEKGMINEIDEKKSS